MLNIGSLIFGLISCIIPIIGIMQRKKSSVRKKLTSLIVSFSACGISLCMQIFNIDHLVKIEDLTAIMDTSSAVAFVSLILLLGTIILNLLSVAKKGMTL